MNRLVLVAMLGLAMLLGGCEQQPDWAVYQDIVKNVQSGKQAVGSDSDIVLPPEQAGAVLGGKARKLSGPGENLLIFFPTYLKGGRHDGYFYSEGPALAAGAVLTAPGSIHGVTVHVERVESPQWYHGYVLFD